VEALFLDQPPSDEDAPLNRSGADSRGPDRLDVHSRGEHVRPISRSTELQQPCMHLAIHRRDRGGTTQDRSVNGIPQPSPQGVDVSAQGGKDHRHAACGCDGDDPLGNDPVRVEDMGTKCPYRSTHCDGFSAEQSGDLEEVGPIRTNVLDDRAGRDPFPTPGEIREALDAQPIAVPLSRPRVRHAGGEHERLEVACFILSEVAHERGRAVALKRRKGRRDYE
jgi:hypothetical protein